MSRSSPGAPAHLISTIWRVEHLLAERYPEPMTPREISDVLREEGYEWPLPRGYYHAGGRTVARDADYGEATPARVRRICEMTGNRTRISNEGGRPMRYSIYRWAVEGVRERSARLAERRAARG